MNVFIPPTQVLTGVSMRALILAIGIITLCSPTLAADDEIYGTWKLVSNQAKILDTGEIIDIAGAVPSGYVMYGRDGRMMVLIVRGSGRPKPDSLATMTDQQRADLFRSMVSYAGTYKFDGSIIEHHIDMSWNNIWTGTTQIRDVKKDGDKLVYTTRPGPLSIDGRMAVTTLVWEKVK